MLVTYIFNNDDNFGLKTRLFKVTPLNEVGITQYYKVMSRVKI